MSTDDPRADGRRESDLAVMEKTEFKQKHRLNQVLRAHDKVETKANEAWELFVGGEISKDAKNIIIQRAVKEFVRECYNLLIEHHRGVEHKRREGTEEARANGHENSDETVPFNYWTGSDDRQIGTILMYDRDDISICGLSDFLQTQELYEESWTERRKPRNMPVRTEHQSVEHSVPEDISWRAYLWLREFLHDEYRLDLEFEGDEMDEQKIVPNY